MGNVQIWEKCCKHVNMASRRGLYETPDWVKVRQCHVDSCFFCRSEARFWKCGWQNVDRRIARCKPWFPSTNAKTPNREDAPIRVCSALQFAFLWHQPCSTLSLCCVQPVLSAQRQEIEKEMKLKSIITSPIEKPRPTIPTEMNIEACPTQPQIVRSESQRLNDDEELLFFFSGQVVCDGNCSSGLMLSSVKAALQQSFQLLLDGFLLGLNHGLGADPEKGRAAASRASKILRRLRAELWEKMTSKLTELDVLMQGIHPEVAQVKSEISLTTIQVAETTKATVKDKLKEFTLAFPSEHQIFLPNPPSETSLQEQFLVLAWFVTVMFVSLRLLTAMTKLAIKLCVSFPRRVLRITCRCCFRCLCPCERKGTQRV